MTIKDRLNKVVTNLTPPPIPLVLSWADAYDGGYGPMLNLSQAVPGYPSHPKLYEWLSEAAASSDFSSYGAVKGDDLLRGNLANHLTELFYAPVDLEETQITSGCNQAFYAALLTLASPGDKVLLTNPCFFNHEYSLQLLGLEPSFVDCRAEQGFVPQLVDIEAAIDDKVKALVLVSPNNPTGAVYPAEILDQIFDFCRSKGIWLVMDETYRDFPPSGQVRPHDLFRKTNWQDSLVQLYSFSKAYSIPGHRIGSITADRSICEEIEKTVDNLQICAPRAAQYAVARGLSELGDWRSENALRMATRAKAFEQALEMAKGWQIVASGAYFAYVKHPMEELGALKVAEQLAKTFGVLAVPGEFFGRDQEAFIRFSFANSELQALAPLANRLNAMAAQ